jgi:hypothetical protein
LCQTRISKSKFNEYYVAIFICPAVKAVHLELIRNLKSGVFIAAPRRITARRWNCLNLYSDNGATFVGAQNELRELRKLFASKSRQSKFPELANPEAFTWHIIRPLDFRRLACAVWNITWIVGVTAFTFEELISLLTQVVAFLNSRTLTALSNDPNDLASISPGHFLVVARLSCFPETKLSVLSPV